MLTPSVVAVIQAMDRRDAAGHAREALRALEVVARVHHRPVDLGVRQIDGVAELVGEDRRAVLSPLMSLGRHEQAVHERGGLGDVAVLVATTRETRYRAPRTSRCRSTLPGSCRRCRRAPRSRAVLHARRTPQHFPRCTSAMPVCWRWCPRSPAEKVAVGTLLHSLKANCGDLVRAFDRDERGDLSKS